MEKESIRIGTPYEIAGITIVPIEKITISVSGYGSSIYSQASKQPIYVIVKYGDRKKILTVSGEQITEADFLLQVPNARSALE